MKSMSDFLGNFISRFLVGGLFILSAQIAQASKPFERGTIEILTSNGPHRFIVELAITQAQRQQGLMWRESLPINTGMLFMFDVLETQQMWMLNTQIPLDILFIDSKQKINKIEKNTKPLSKRIVSSVKPALWVLELRAGTSTRLGIKVGDQIRLYNRNKIKTWQPVQ